MTREDMMEDIYLTSWSSSWSLLVIVSSLPATCKLSWKLLFKEGSQVLYEKYEFRWKNEFRWHRNGITLINHTFNFVAVMPFSDLRLTILHKLTVTDQCFFLELQWTRSIMTVSLKSCTIFPRQGCKSADLQHMFHLLFGRDDEIEIKNRIRGQHFLYFQIH